MGSSQGGGVCDVLALVSAKHGSWWKTVEDSGRRRWKQMEVSIEGMETSGGFLEGLDF